MHVGSVYVSVIHQTDMDCIRAYVILLMHANTHEGWAHPQHMHTLILAHMSVRSYSGSLHADFRWINAFWRGWLILTNATIKCIHQPIYRTICPQMSTMLCWWSKPLIVQKFTLQVSKQIVSTSPTVFLCLPNQSPKQPTNQETPQHLSLHPGLQAKRGACRQGISAKATSTRRLPPRGPNLGFSSQLHGPCLGWCTQPAMD